MRVALPARANWMASAVPQEPLPSTAMGGDAISSFAGGGELADRLRLRVQVQRIEVHRRQQQLREAALRHQLRDHRARIREQHAGADAGDGALGIFLGQVLHQERAGLLHFDEEQRLVVLLGGHRHRQHDFAQVALDGVAGGREIEVDLRLPVAFARAVPAALRRSSPSGTRPAAPGWAAWCRRGCLCGRCFVGHDLRPRFRMEQFRRPPARQAGDRVRPRRPARCVVVSHQGGARRRRSAARCCGHCAAAFPAARLPLSSMSISVYATPLRSSSARARVQYPHPDRVLHHYLRRAVAHDDIQPRCSGRPSVRHCARPPRRLNTFVNPPRAACG